MGKKPKLQPKKKPVKSPPVTDAPKITESGYDSYRQSQAAIARARADRGREIGPLPPVGNPKRREACRANPELFLQTYLKARFFLPFASVHKETIETIRRCLMDGGRFAKAMMRGGGKTAIAEGMAIWAILYGYRTFLVLVHATKPLSVKSLAKLSSELEFNDMLAEDFPEVCYPIRKLERSSNRSRRQTLDGKPTRMQWTKDGVILPTVEGSPSSGSVLHVTGIEGSIRGLSMSGPDGGIIRPDAVLIDDAQTRGSAKSPTQTADRESIITDDIMGLAGPTTEIAAVNLCTPIYPNDLTERFLDTKRHPDWQGSRTRMLESFPKNMALWDEYAEILRDSLRSGNQGKRATAFYRMHRKEMDEGAVVTWPERMKPSELSGIQSAMNLNIGNPKGFKAEYQCEPEEPAASSAIKSLAPADFAKRLSGCERFVVPREASRLTAFIDVGVYLHWYVVVAWTERFDGSVVDYGCWPRQSRSFFSASDARPKLADYYSGMAEEARTYTGLTELTNEIHGRTYRRDVKADEVRIERCLIDSGDQTSTVYLFCRQSPHAGVIYPSKGIARTTSARGVAEWKPRPGERSGYHWRLTVSETGTGRSVQFDPDMWKSFIYQRASCPMGTPGALTIFNKDSSDHEMLSQHMAAEYGEPQTIRGVTFDKWSQLPHRPDNHLFDCCVGAAVAASVQGLTPMTTAAPVTDEGPAVKVINMREEARKSRLDRDHVG